MREFWIQLKPFRQGFYRAWLIGAIVFTLYVSTLGTKPGLLFCVLFALTYELFGALIGCLLGAILTLIVQRTSLSRLWKMVLFVVLGAAYGTIAGLQWDIHFNFCYPAMGIAGSIAFALAVL